MIDQVKRLNMVQYHDTIRMVNFINPTSTIGIVIDLYPLYSASLPVVPLVRYDLNKLMMFFFIIIKVCILYIMYSSNI